MSAKIIVEKLSFMRHPSVFLEVERLSDHVKVESTSVIVKPRPGFLIPVLVRLSKAKIEYTLKYDSIEAETAVPEIKK